MSHSEALDEAALHAIGSAWKAAVDADVATAVDNAEAEANPKETAPPPIGFVSQKRVPHIAAERHPVAV